MNGRFSDELWDGITDIYAAILAHPFLAGMTDGSLSADAFAFYVVQDALYLRRYAQALAASAGKITDAKHSQIVSPLYKSFRTVDFLSGAKADPLEFTDEKTVLTSKEKAMGIGVAQGDHPVLGKNATYVVLLFGTRK